MKKNQRSKKEERRKSIKNKSFKEIHKDFTKKWNKQVLQNKPFSFRPTDKQWIHMRDLETVDKSDYVRQAIDLRMELLEDPENFFIKWGRRLNEPFKRANRKLGREKKEWRKIYD